MKKQSALVLLRVSFFQLIQFEAYLKGDKDARLGYCASKDEYIFGYKAHIVTDAESELPIAVVVTPANEHDSKQFLPLMKRILKNFTYEVKKLLADSGYDAMYIRKWLRKHQIEDIIDRNKRTGIGFEKPKDPDYKKRVASERVNSYAKDGFALELLSLVYRGHYSTHMPLFLQCSIQQSPAIYLV